MTEIAPGCLSRLLTCIHPCEEEKRYCKLFIHSSLSQRTLFTFRIIMAQTLDRCVTHIVGKKRLSDSSNFKMLIVLSLSFRFPGIQEGADLQDL